MNQLRNSNPQPFVQQKTMSTQYSKKGDKKMKIIRIVIAAIMMGSVHTVHAADPPESLSSVPEFMNYQGRLVTPDGDPYSNTTHKVQLQLYNQDDGSTAVWGEEYSVETQDGYFSVLLGSGGTPIEGSSSNDLWRSPLAESGRRNSPRDTFFMGVTCINGCRWKRLY